MNANTSELNTGSPDAGASRRRKGFRWIPACVIGLTGFLSAAAVDRWVEDQTFQVIAFLYIAIFTSLAFLLWWLFFSGVSWKTRILGLFGSVVILFIGARLLVAAVVFDGAMKPQIRWVWEPSPRDVSEEWLSRNARDGTVAASDQNPITITASDWPRYCGHNGDRVIDEPMVNLNWKSQPPKELWRHPVGAAWSSFSVVGKRLYTQEQRGEQECVVCYNADDGTEIWRREDATRYETAMGGIGPRATPTVTESAVFSLGATGILNALDPGTGELIWQRNICEDAGSEVLEWGMSGSPFVYENTIIVDAGGSNDKAVIAYEQTSGDIVWSSENHQAGYATPRVETIDGEEHLLIFHGDGLLGMDPMSGQKLWKFPWTNMYKINVAQPIRFGDAIFLSSGYDAGCVLIDPTQLDGDVPREVWPRNNRLKLKFNEAVRLGNYVYGLDDGILCCVDLRTGERVWKGGRYRFGQVLLWQDKLIVSAEKGYIAAVAATPEGHQELARFTVLDGRTWNMHVVNRGRLYVRNAYEAACFDLQQIAE